MNEEFTDKESLLSDWATNHKSSGISVAQMIIDYYPAQIGALANTDFWPHIQEPYTDSYIDVDIISTSVSGWTTNTLEEYADSVSTSIQFPKNTCLLHGLGCVSSAMSRQFKYVFKGDHEHPVNLYCVGAQPPSTGKSGIHSSFLNPIRIAYQGKNSNNASIRASAEKAVKSANKELKGCTNPIEEEALELEISKNLTIIANHPNYILSVDDSTPEGLEKMMGLQGGWANLLSDESDVINTMLGFTYGDKARKTNNGIFLKMFDGEWQSSVRSGRDGYNGPVVGSFAVLAQAESVDSILLAGQSGRGVSERFLLIKEPHVLSQRDHTTYTPIDANQKTAYINMINQLVSDDGRIFTFSAPAKRLIDMYRNEIEAEMGDDGKYSDNMMRGAMGKADKQICKIACILWGAQEWSTSGRQRTEIGVKTTQRAIEIFKELSRTYLQAAEDSGYAGLTPKIEKVGKYLRKKYKKDQKAKQIPTITAQSLQQSLKKVDGFSNISGLTKYLKNFILPALESDGTLLLSRGVYYINPRILDSEE